MTVRRSQIELLALGGYTGIAVSATVFALAWLAASAFGGRSPAIGIAASTTAVVALIVCVAAATRSRAEISAQTIAIINPWRSRTIDRRDVTGVSLYRTTAQILSVRATLADGTNATVIGVGPNEVEQFRKALALSQH